MLSNQDLITTKEGEAMANELGAQYVEISSIQQKNLDELQHVCLRAGLTRHGRDGNRPKPEGGDKNCVMM